MAIFAIRITISKECNKNHVCLLLLKSKTRDKPQKRWWLNINKLFYETKKNKSLYFLRIVDYLSRKTEQLYEFDQFLFCVDTLLPHT